MAISLETPIQELYMIGDKYAEKLNKYLNIHTVKDLLYHFPFRYDDLTTIKAVSEVRVGETVTLEGQILTLKNTYTRSGKQLQQGIFTDGKSPLTVTWFNQPYLVKTLSPGTRVSLAGTISRFGGKIGLTAPKFEILKSHPKINTTPIHTGRLVPVYPETYEISSKWLRSRIQPILKQIESLVEDWLPEEIRSQERFLPLSEALRNIHFPKTINDAETARKRLAFDELFLLQLQIQQKKKEWQQTKLRHKLTVQFEDLTPFLEKLPFELTQDQIKAIKDTIDDLNQETPMNRLLEGDVGSGKTVVAAAAIYLSHLKKVKAVFMAPTEVLANQHFKTLSELLEPHNISIGFYTGSKKSKGKLEDYDVYLGTHALLFQDLDHTQIGLVIIDEQHRFGVEQRARLLGGTIAPHVLSMTATPIPRTAALTLYGDLALSLITTMPKGRKPVKTWLVPHSKRLSAYSWIADQVQKHKSQAYFIYPLIDPSEKTMMTEIKAAKAEYEKLKKHFSTLKVGLLHGKLKSKEKQEVMENFAKHKLDILVATSVIEVGIDVANASIIVIEGADRFGLSQLHQLRGRVGRGDQQSYCLLFSSTDGSSNRRLKAMETIQSGIELAELDLKLRGPGELYGTMQSGFLDLKLASFNDKELIDKTYRCASNFISRISEFPLLHKRLTSCTIGNIKPN
ncbi:MAG: ATP-dependent DNA helicase RecG [Patescibacteria group bacterium]|jgi:ATP-dependent DNA helicase RecG